MMRHSLCVSATEDGHVQLVCEEDGHDWSWFVNTPESVNIARRQHDDEVRGSMQPGLYLVETTMADPRVYLLLPDRSWKIADRWSRANEPSLDNLTPLAEADTEAIR